MDSEVITSPVQAANGTHFRPSMPAIILGGAMNALSVARGLWSHGIVVDVFGDAADSPAKWSRAVRNYHRMDNHDAEGRWMGLLAERSEPSVLLPGSDEALEFIARHRSELVKLGHRPIEADDGAVLQMLDKSRTYEIARAAGVPAPDTITITSTDDLDHLHHFRFPCAIKPVESHVFTRRFHPVAKGAHVSSAHDASQLLGPIVKEGVPMLLTEVVEGTDECCSYYTYLDENGDPLFHYTKRKLRVYPTGFGLGTYHVSQWLPEVADLGLRFCRAAKLKGVANVEFKRDTRDGRLRLIECNARFTNAQEVVRRSGIDMGMLAYARLTGMSLPPIDGFRDRVGLLFLTEDLQALAAYRRQGQLSVSEWLRSLAMRQATPFFDWRDPKPSAMNAVSFGRRAARHAIRATRGSSGDGHSHADPYGDPHRSPAHPSDVPLPQKGQGPHDSA